MKNINIPEPCSENWNEMTPSDKGAFCKKCAFDVYDFTNKSGDEIREVLTLNIGSRVCGHINKAQLEELNSDFSSWQVNNKQSYQRAWIFTLFVVFGMTLFSCEEDEEPVVEKFQKVGQTILIETEPSEILEIEATLGEVSVTKAVETPFIEANTIEPQDYKSAIRGMISYQEKNLQTQEELPLIDYPKENLHYILDGMMRTSSNYEAHLLQTKDVNPEVDFSENKKMSGLVYPNPASNQTILKVNMPRRGKAEIELFGLNGQKIRTIHSGRIRKGESEYSIDLTALEIGLYFVVIYCDGNKETVKFSKM